MTEVTPVLLIILDGFGYRENGPDNAIDKARKPNWDLLWNKYAHTTIHASEIEVGLPEHQMGNSEVGHLNIGAGRVIYQEYTRIEHAIKTGEFFNNPTLKNTLEKVAHTGKALHILGLLSPGGVHSHESQIHAMLEMAQRYGVNKIYIHAFLDGRDTPPKSAAASLTLLQRKCVESKTGMIASIIGRYFAMDRDKRWDRINLAYDLLALGKSEFQATDALQALDMAYARGETDEFVKPTAILDKNNQPIAIADGDAVVFMNFRADRARQITRVLTDPNFSEFKRERFSKLSNYVCLTHYGDEFDLPVAYEPQTIHNSFGEYLSQLGYKQLRIAETEKYAHVTYFFNGGVEEPYQGEDRILVPSPKVATYDLKPEMSAYEVTEKLEAAILSRQYQAIVCNYANGDMVGHTGSLPAAIKAIETLDECIGKVVSAMQKINGEILITADHGNAEMMYDESTQQPHTAHTLNVVPLLYIGRKARIAPTGALQDVAPTLLRMMGLQQPTDMTGKALIEFV